MLSFIGAPTLTLSSTTDCGGVSHPWSGLWRILLEITNHQNVAFLLPTPPSLSVLLTWDDDGFLWLVAAIEMIPQPQSNTRQGWGDRSPPFGGQDIGLRLKLKCWLVCQNRRMTLSAKRLWIRAGKLPQSGILINFMRPQVPAAQAEVSQGLRSEKTKSFPPKFYVQYLQGQKKPPALWHSKAQVRFLQGIGKNIFFREGWWKISV